MSISGHFMIALAGSASLEFQRHTFISELSADPFDTSPPINFDGMDAPSPAACAIVLREPNEERTSQISILGKAEFLASRAGRIRCVSPQPFESVALPGATGEVRRPAAGAGRSSATRSGCCRRVKPFVKRERRGGRGRRSRVPPDVRRREDRGTAVAWNGRHEAWRQRTALRGREFGIAAPQGATNVRKLALPASPELPGASRPTYCNRGLNGKIAEQQGDHEGRRGLEAEHARSRDRFGSLRTGRTQGATSRPGSA